MKELINRISIKGRMILAFVLVILMFGWFGIFSISEMGKLSELTQTLYDHPLRVSNAALAAHLGVVKMHRTVKNIVLAESEADLQLKILQIHEDEVFVYEQLDIIKANILGDAGKALEQETRKFFADWRPQRSQVIELKQKGDTLAATRLTSRLNTEYVQKLENRMLELNQYALNKATGFIQSAELIRRNTIRLTIGSILLVVLISLAIAFTLSSSILVNITALTQKMSDIIETGQFSPISISGNNELSVMTEYFNRLVARLQEQIWIRDGKNELNQILSEVQSFENVAEQSLRSVAHHVNACAGALFSYEADTAVCELKSSYAFVAGKHLAKRFEIGEGIVGQVAAEKNPILLEHIDGVDAIGQSGTLREPPKAIYCLPLVFEKALLGVLEIASFTVIDRAKREYLEAAAFIIATGLNTSLQNQRIKELLQQSEAANMRLQNQQEELKALNEELTQQSEELRQQNRLLENQRRQVEEASRMKSEFLSNMSHELRTPLNSINALSKVLIVQAGDRLSAEETNYLEIIQRNGKHLLTLINDILDLSKIEAGKMELSPSSFSLAALLATILENLQPVASEKAIALISQIPADFPWVFHDESKVHKILQNVIGNAVKFTETGKVTVSAAYNATWAQIKVEDTGIGIAAKDLPYIFEEFRQADGSTSRRFEGTGLGLAIAQKAAKKLGGEIRVESVPDQGSIFTITLPLRSPSQATADDVKPAPASPVFGARTLSDPKTVLVVDDDPKIIAFIAENLIGHGYRTLTATTGKEALHLAEIFQPFAITLDVFLPELDGWEVLQTLKNNPKTKNIPVIMVSISKDRDTGFALGANGYITKPVNAKDLITEIRKIGRRNSQTIMIVDDNTFERDEMVNIVEGIGMKAIPVANGVQCLRILENTVPDLLILDLMMPEMDGFGVLQSIRSNERLQQIPVIIATAKDLTMVEKSHLQHQVSSIMKKGERDASGLLRQINLLLNQVKQSDSEKGVQPELQRNLVLMVEDNESAVIQVKQILNAEGIDVAVARNGFEALAYVEHALPAGIILDLMMPGMDGFTVLEAIRGTAATAKLPVLILTAKDLSADDLKRLSSNNVQQLIQKGDIDKEGLIRKTKQMLGQHTEPTVSPMPLKIPSRPKILEKSSHQPATVLIIEDNPDNLVTIKAVLKGDYRLLNSVDGLTGLEIIRSEKPDIVLLDISLPGVDGITLVKMIRAEETIRQIPVIALTARAMKGDKETILAAGCNDYLSKPFDPEALLEKINHWLA